jgi:endogenous inhibitor of DNA gyrase (YacG/DUF329 family)
VKCPQCERALAADADARWRPFCSERCKLADLGRWFAGRYAIPAEDDADLPGTPQDPMPRQ